MGSRDVIDFSLAKQAGQRFIINGINFKVRIKVALVAINDVGSILQGGNGGRAKDFVLSIRMLA